MKAIDTNIIIRFLINDDEMQAKKVLDLFKNAEKKEEKLFVPLLVIIESIWVMDSVYAIPRIKIIEALKKLFMLPFLIFEQPVVLHQLLQISENDNFDLPDLLIGLSAQANGCESVLTFDKKAAKHHLFEYLK